MPDPVLHLVAGPNGSGKTTLFEDVIRPVTGLAWVNADDIAAEFGRSGDPARSYEAARRAMLRRAELMAARESFATETVFSHPSKVELVRDAVAVGYLVTLHVLLVPEDLAVARVELRVEQGGHAVPEEKVRARYRRLWTHIADAIALAHEAYVFDNTNAAKPFRLVAKFESGRAVGKIEWPVWVPEELRALSSQ
jgi:predicted ABC-type ATPase